MMKFHTWWIKFPDLDLPMSIYHMLTVSAICIFKGFRREKGCTISGDLYFIGELLIIIENLKFHFE